eukprot:235487_1
MDVARIVASRFGWHISIMRCILTQIQTIQNAADAANVVRFNTLRIDSENHELNPLCSEMIGCISILLYFFVLVSCSYSIDRKIIDRSLLRLEINRCSVTGSF